MLSCVSMSEPEPDCCPVRGSGARWRERAAGEARGSPSSPPEQTTEPEVRCHVMARCQMFALYGVHFNGLFLVIHTLICIFYLNVKQCDKTHNIFLHTKCNRNKKNKCIHFTIWTLFSHMMMSDNTRFQDAEMFSLRQDSQRRWRQCYERWGPRDPGEERW